MKRLTVLFTAAAVITYSLLASNQKKTEVKVITPKLDNSKIYLESPKCPRAIVASSSSSLDVEGDEISPYKHCSKCGMGAFLGEGEDVKCSYCGITGD